jgi:hypothetical protein
MERMRKLALVVLFSFIAFLANSNPISAADPTPRVPGKEIWQERTDANGTKQSCGFFTGCTVAGTDVKINLTGIAYNNGKVVPDDVYVQVDMIGKGMGCPDYKLVGYAVGGRWQSTVPGDKIKTNCQYALRVTLPSGTFNDGTEVEAQTYESPYAPEAQAACSDDECDSDLGVLQSSLYELCSQIKKGTDQYDACMACFTNNGVWTAVGCIPSKPESIIQTIITIGLAVGGGVVLVMILVGSFMLSVSQGDPNKTKEAREIITSAIIGLLFVIFSVTILQFIGVSILHIPGFGE